MSKLQNKCVWLTGATSGIGEALVYELLKRGAKVAITARRADVLEQVAKKASSLGGSLGGQIRVYPGDVQDLALMKKIVSEIETDLAPIDLLIANAGTHIFSKPEQFDSAEYLDLMEINFGGMVKCIEAVLPSMQNRRSGQIAGMASMAGLRGLPRAAAYGASKAAMINFLESIRFHLVRQGISINVVNPGFVKTPLTDKNDFYMPFLISAERAAKEICKGLEKNKREITFPFIFSRILKLARILPAPLYERIVDRLW